MDQKSNAQYAKTGLAQPAVPMLHEATQRAARAVQSAQDAAHRIEMSINRLVGSVPQPVTGTPEKANPSTLLSMIEENGTNAESLASYLSMLAERLERAV